MSKEPGNAAGEWTTIVEEAIKTPDTVGRTFRSLAEALVGGSQELHQSDYDRLVASFLAYAAGLPALHRAGLLWGLRALEALPLISRRPRRFSALSASERAVFLARMETCRGFPVRTFILGLKSAAIMVCFDDPVLEAAAGYSHGCLISHSADAAGAAGGGP